MKLRGLLKRPNKRRFPADWLIIGLGNPGREYAGTRHNLGFWAINRLARRAGANLKRTGSTMQIGTGQVAGMTVALVKPLTYVNRSGAAARQAESWTGCDATHTVLIYDDLDLPPGALRIRAGGGTGGHNGLKSLVSALGPDFIRVRIGIGRPEVDGKPSRHPDVVADYVLSDPPPAERELLEHAVELALEAIEVVMTEGPDVAGTRFNRRGP